MVLQKVIIVGPEVVHTFFTETYVGQWDTQVSVERANDVWDGLSNNTLSQESNIVIFTDGYFDDPNFANEYEDVVEAIAAFAPAALVLVMFYNLANYERLQQDVAEKQRSLGQPEIGFYPIDVTADTSEEIYKAQEHYMNYVVPYQNAAPEDTTNDVHYPPVEDPAATADYGYEEQIQQPVYSEPQQPSKKRGLIVASTSSKGGSGKTTVGMLTASAFYHASKAAVDQGLREEPLKVCIVDMDIRDGQIGFIIQKSQPTVLNLYSQGKQDDETILQHMIHDPGMGFYAMLAPKRARTADYLTPDFYVHLIDRLSYLFDVVVLDTSVDYTDVLLSKVVFPMANAILFVTNFSVGSIYGMNRWVDDVTTPVDKGGPGIALSKIGVVVNQAGDEFGIDPELLRVATAGAEILTRIPMDNKAVISASNQNKLSDILKYHEGISPSYYHIVKTLMPNEILADPLIQGYGGGGAAPPAPTPNGPSSSPGGEGKKRRKLGFGR